MRTSVLRSFSSFFFVFFVFLVLVVGAAPAAGQALPNFNSLRVRYNSQKNAVNPQGELKAQIDAIDRELTTATLLGRTGEMRRLYAKGMALLANRGWTELDDFRHSLVLRSDRVVVDSSQPYRVRLEQIYAPAIDLSSTLSARVAIRLASPIPAAGAPAAGTQQPPAPAIEIGKFDGVGRDLRESPFALDLNLASVPDGAHNVEVEVIDGARVLGPVTLRIAVQKGIDARLALLETAAVTAAADVRADIRYPADYIRKINQGLIELGSFNVSRELSSAEEVAAAAKGGKNPFAGRTGDFERHYLLEEAGEIMPYRVYVPKKYDGSRAYPLIIALHGLGANEDSMFDGYGRRVPTLAEERGYIVAAPLGYRVDGFYGWSSPQTAGDSSGRRRSELSEKDVLNVLQRMRAQYKIDDSRIFLMGHSMGAIGTWAIAAKHPTIWAAIAPFSGLGSPATLAPMRHIPQIVVHGDADNTVNVSGSRTMVAEMQKLGVDHKYIEVPGGNHTDMVAPNMTAVFDFFDSKRKKAATTSQR